MNPDYPLYICDIALLLTAIVCDEPPEHEMATITNTQIYTIGNTAIYQCPFGHIVNGSNPVTDIFTTMCVINSDLATDNWSQAMESCIGE